MTTTAPQFFSAFCHSDVIPCEVVRVVSAKTVDVRSMRSEMAEWTPDFEVGGFAAHCNNQHEQKWTITSDPAGEVVRLRLNKFGKWCDADGRTYKAVSEPQRFHDYNR